MGLAVAQNISFVMVPVFGEELVSLVIHFKWVLIRHISASLGVG
jgi:hypothetical protein